MHDSVCAAQVHKEIGSKTPHLCRWARSRRSTQARFDRALKRGAFFNVLGMIAKLVHPLFVAVLKGRWCERTIAQCE